MTRRSGPAPLFIANSTFRTIHGYIRCRSKIWMARSLISNGPACHSGCGGATALRLCLVGDYSREAPLRTAVTYPAAVAPVFWCIASFVVVDALAASLERIEF